MDQKRKADRCHALLDASPANKRRVKLEEECDQRGRSSGQTVEEFAPLPGEQQMEIAQLEDIIKEEKAALKEAKEHAALVTEDIENLTSQLALDESELENLTAQLARDESQRKETRSNSIAGHPHQRRQVEENDSTSPAGILVPATSSNKDTGKRRSDNEDAKRCSKKARSKTQITTVVPNSLRPPVPGAGVNVASTSSKLIVFCVRGTLYNKEPGNMAFSEAGVKCIPEYKKAKGNDQKRDEIIAKFTESFEFRKKQRGMKGWVLVSEKFARYKILKLLNDERKLK